MKLFISALVAATAIIVSPPLAMAQAVEADSLPPAQVIVVRAVSACF